VVLNQGKYYFVVMHGITSPVYNLIPFTLNVKNYNVNCGDGIIDANEACDNGNKVGCSSGCIPDPGYICSQTLGSTSFCYQNAIISSCGNAIVEKG
jgi:cysteine-rich repeat protein